MNLFPSWMTRDGDMRETEIREAIEEVTRKVVTDALQDAADTVKKYRELTRLQDTVTSLKEQIETLKIEKARKQEDFDRREREVEHKVGLSLERQDFEVQSAKREAELDLREEALESQRKQFTEQMDFLTKRFEEEVTYQREVLEKVLDRLPSAEIIARIGNGREVVED